MITAKAKSCIHHLTTAMSGLEKAKIHLLQAQAVLPKKDEEGRRRVKATMLALSDYEDTTVKAIQVITEANPSLDLEF